MNCLDANVRVGLRLLSLRASLDTATFTGRVLFLCFAVLRACGLTGRSNVVLIRPWLPPTTSDTRDHPQFCLVPSPWILQGCGGRHPISGTCWHLCYVRGCVGPTSGGLDVRASGGLTQKATCAPFGFPVLVNILSSPRSFRLLRNFASLEIYAGAASGKFRFGHGRVAVVMSITGCRNRYFRHDCHCRKPYMEERGRGTALSSTLPRDMFSGGI